MSYRSGQYSEYPQHHPHNHGRALPQRAAVAVLPQPAAQNQRGYTLVHAGRQVRIGPVLFWIAVGSVILLGLWSAATATYFAFRDDVLTRLIARQAEMQYAYEDRIAELRAKVDRTTSRQLLDQEQFDQKLDQIMRRHGARIARHRTWLVARCHRIDQVADARRRRVRCNTGNAETFPDQRHRDLRRAARSRGAPGIAHTCPADPRSQPIRQGPGRGECRRTSADFAGPG
jgi:hypothetical protein